MNNQLQNIDLKRLIPWATDELNFNVNFQFIIKENFYKRDTSNMIKLTEDVLFRHMGVNDSRVVELHQAKSFDKSNKKEYLLINIKESTFPTEFDPLLKPLPSKDCIDFMVPVSYIESINKLYSYNSRTKKVFTSNEARKYKSELLDGISKINFHSGNEDWLIKHQNYNLSLQFILKTRYYDRDTSNMIKMTEDVLFKHLGYNDSRVVEGHQYKSFIGDRGDGKEFVRVRLAKSDFDVNYFQ